MLNILGNAEKLDEVGSEADLDDVLSFANTLLLKVQPHKAEWPDAVYKSIAVVADCLEANEDYKQAAFARMSVDFEAGQCTVPASDRVEWYIDSAVLFLSCEDSGSASQAMRAAQSNYNERDNKTSNELRIRYHLCFARVSDHQRKFVDASKRYHDLTMTGALNEQDARRTLQNAVTCCILGKAGPQRSRVLGILYEDNRTNDLANRAMLVNMYTDRIIRQSQVEVFDAMLQEHQRTVNRATGRSVLQQAVIEHNMRAARKIYNNITFTELARILGISAGQAEDIAAGMIESKRLTASIDQVNGILEFRTSEGLDKLHTFDHRIESTCQALQKITTAVSKQHPEFTV
jgi:COP9 signalosome complex subunit 4